MRIYIHIIFPLNVYLWTEYRNKMNGFFLIYAKIYRAIEMYMTLGAKLHLLPPLNGKNERKKNEYTSEMRGVSEIEKKKFFIFILHWCRENWKERRKMRFIIKYSSFDDCSRKKWSIDYCDINDKTHFWPSNE